MRRLALLIFTLWLLCVALLGTAIWIGQRQPLSQRVLALRLTDCAPPCWIGIMPGKTRISEAQRIIADSFKQSAYRLVWDTEVQSDLMVRFLPQPEGAVPEFAVRIDFAADTDYVGQINVFAPSNNYKNRPPTVADVVALWGIPACVDGESNLIYNNMTGQSSVVVQFWSRTRMSESTILSIGMPHPSANWCDNSFPLRYFKNWRGFLDWYYQP